MNTYQRTCQIERAEGAESGIITGTLVTDGEASDGHILNIAGGELPERAPLLFGHDDYTGTGNLGSWTAFYRDVVKGGKLGSSRIRGAAEIELSGDGPQAAWRKDIDLMIEKGHIGSFSVRWSETEDPVRRVNLPSDHPAYVDEKKATGRQRWGLYFEKWRLLEGSVVTLGADPAALIGRMQQAEGDVRQYWRKTVNHALEERHDLGDLVGVEVAGGEIVYIERAAWEAMLEEANRRCSVALDLQEDAYAELRMAHDLIRTASTIRSEEEQAEASEDPEETQQEPKEDAAPLPAPPQKPEEVIAALGRQLREAKAAVEASKREKVMAPGELIGILKQKLDAAQQRVNAKKRAEMEQARGRVVHDG